MLDPITPESMVCEAFGSRWMDSLSSFQHHPVFWIEAASDQQITVRWNFDAGSSSLIHTEWSRLCAHLECAKGGHSMEDANPGYRVFIKRYRATSPARAGFKRQRP